MGMEEGCESKEWDHFRASHLIRTNGTVHHNHAEIPEDPWALSVDVDGNIIFKETSTRVLNAEGSPVRINWEGCDKKVFVAGGISSNEEGFLHLVVSAFCGKWSSFCYFMRREHIYVSLVKSAFSGSITGAPKEVHARAPESTKAS